MKRFNANCSVCLFKYAALPQGTVVARLGKENNNIIVVLYLKTKSLGHKESWSSSITPQLYMQKLFYHVDMV